MVFHSEKENKKYYTSSPPLNKDLHKKKIQIIDVKKRLIKGIDWFIKAWDMLWDKHGNPIHINSELERKFSDRIVEWLDLQKKLRNVLGYDRCIYGVGFNKGFCPSDSPVKCDGCM